MIGLRFLHPTQHTDFLPSQSHGLVVSTEDTIPNTTEAETGTKWQKTKLASEECLNQQLILRTAHICVHITVHNCHTQYSTEQF